MQRTEPYLPIAQERRRKEIGKMVVQGAKKTKGITRVKKI
jgi:hypothetical protein